MKTRSRNLDRRKDISLGQEHTPIPVECPENVPLPSFNYITEHIIGHASTPPSDRSGIKSCKCDTVCNDLEKCRCIGITHNRNVFFECGDLCSCSDECENRKISNSILPKMTLRYINKDMDFGIFAKEIIKKDVFAGKYVGDISELNPLSNPEKNSDYIFLLHSLVAQRDVEIDATDDGNVTRFYNHSCEPTLETKHAYLGKHRWLYPVFFASRDIEIGEELTINYGISSYFSKKNYNCQCKHCIKSL